jgi:hypothetical protein
MRTSWLLLLLPGLLQAQAAVAQATLGRLYYATSAGRAVTLRAVDAGPGRLTLAPESGDAGRLRNQVLEHTGDPARLGVGAIRMADPVPPAWQGGSRDAFLLQTTEAIYWRRLPGEVLPARFQLAGQVWQLLTADLPSERVFASR